uniref:TIL domain-containing protein n=1 Tax=Panagrolaimus sp. ES5 TaxID=591445 RepID=A0AC34FJB3_9BILA
MCIQMCMPAKCQCIEGTARNAQATVKQEQKCNQNEQWVECATACEASCDKPEDVYYKKMMNKFAVIFVVLIFTAEFAVGQLLWPGQQSMTCGENEIFKQCANKANRCEPSCAVPKPMICTLMCGQGCDCQDGFLRSQNGKCVRPNQC